MHLNTFSMASFSISSSFTFTCLKIFCLIGQDKRLKHINGKLGRPVSMSTWKRRPINSKTASCWRRPRRSKSNRTSPERATTKTTNFARFAGGLKSIIKQRSNLKMIKFRVSDVAFTLLNLWFVVEWRMFPDYGSQGNSRGIESNFFIAFSAINCPAEHTKTTLPK